jgi:hypothetical protein
MIEQAGSRTNAALLVRARSVGALVRTRAFGMTPSLEGEI